ncbi:response regulator [Bradyrhizobium sp. DOA1]|uniref:response regulator n=1 Tax=Bradyrhizobium sp. DOA1 TaxID=1126616 RepID=UPI00077CB0EB|nr:response regulator [Bradyrhizobium sp. DOA1]KYH01912.1 transcriptional regulator [Bradyrhizobium sp. DOA1]
MPEGPAVLVVEDEYLLIAPLEDALKDAGFETAFVSSGEEAAVLLRAQKNYRALLTDINLGGGINGWEVAKIARHEDPTFPVIYMTGANADEWAVEGVPNSILLSKPFAPAQAVTAISQLLNKDIPGT